MGTQEIGSCTVVSWTGFAYNTGAGAIREITEESKKHPAKLRHKVSHMPPAAARNNKK